MSLVKSSGDYSPSAPATAGALEAQFDVPSSLAGLRVDQALSRLLPEYSRSRLTQWIKDARIRIDGEGVKPNQRIRGGERVCVQADLTQRQGQDQPQDIGLVVVFEDEHLLVVNKPPGLVVHPGSGNLDGTLLNALLHHAPSLAAVPRAGIVHRLDKDTSGLLVVAKTLPAQLSLARQLLARTVSRQYLAVATGVVPPSGTVDSPIGRHPVQRTRMAVVAKGRASVTHFRRLSAGLGWSVVECRLQTGRTHQIRVHLQSLGHPLVGDPAYGSRARERALPARAQAFARQALHAARLELQHPARGDTLAWSAPLPEDLVALIHCLEHDAPAP